MSSLEVVIWVLGLTTPTPTSYDCAQLLLCLGPLDVDVDVGRELWFPSPAMIDACVSSREEEKTTPGEDFLSFDSDRRSLIAEF